MPVRHGCSYFLLLCFLTVVAATSVAQDSTFRYSVAYMPQYLIEKGYRIEGEAQLNGRFKAWRLTLGLQYNTGEVPQYNDESITSMSDEVTGYGVEPMLKYFINDWRKDRNNYYLAAGPAYHHFNIDFFGRTFVPQTVDGLEVLVLNFVTQEMTINCFTVSVLAGNQMVLGNRFMLDVYMGIAGRYSATETAVPNVRLYDDNMSNYAYSGLMFRGGFKLGVFIN